MYIIDCLPFSKGLKKDSLSYFSSNIVEPGSLIKVPVRSKSIYALVIESRDVREIKSEIKSADFQVKKISSVTMKPFLEKEFLEAVRESAAYFAGTEGGVLSHLLPSFILENPNLLTAIKYDVAVKQNSSDISASQKNKGEVLVLQAEDEERFIHYKSLIREEFAKRKSVFLCLPQNEYVKKAKDLLSRGIEQYVISFHKDMTKKAIKDEWKKVTSTSHPVLVIGTARWLFINRKDFGTIILDEENENGWKTLERPYLDLRHFIETLAQKKDIRLILGDSFLRTETLYRHKEGYINEFKNVKWRLPLIVKTKVVDMKAGAKEEKEFKTVSRELSSLITSNIESGSHMFIFAARKGLSSSIVCRDCGEQVKCGNCSSPMVLYKTKAGGAFRCHQCGETRDAAEYCQNCKSWKLGSYGAGIDMVAEEIRKSFPDINLFELHKDIAPTSIKAWSIANDFYKKSGSVLLGTEAAFPYIHKKIENAAIASFDSLFSIPDFRIREKIFRVILEVRNSAKENLLIQSRNPEDKTIEFAVSGNLLEFYKKEIDDRKPLLYPPFGTFIKITARGTRNMVMRETETLKNIFSHPDDSVTIFNSIHEKRGEQAAVNAILKLPHGQWPTPSLLSLLKSLPPHFEIKVDPDNLL